MNDREQLLQSLMRSKLEQSAREKQAAFERRCLVFAMMGLIGLVTFLGHINSVKNNEQDDRLNKIEVLVKKQQKDIYQIKKEVKNLTIRKSPYKAKTQAKSKNLIIANALIDRGFSKENAAAITGNIMIESLGNPHSIGDSGTSIGYIQWHADRKDNLINFAKKRGKHWSDHDTQLDFLVHEYKNTAWNKHYKQAFKQTTVKQKAYTFCEKVEKPDKRAFRNSINTRMNIAINTYNALKGA